MDGAVAIVVAAGSGDRLGLGLPKAFVPLAGTTLLEHAVANAIRSRAVVAVVAVVPSGWEDRAGELLGALGTIVVVPGAATRQASVRAGLAAPTPASGANVVLCHDAARPLAPPALFDAAVAALADADGAVPVLPSPDTIKRVRQGFVEGTPPREGTMLAQTPQAFAADVLRRCHERAGRDGLAVTDDSALLEAYGHRVRAIDGDERAFKVTNPDDLARAEAMLREPARD